MNNIKQYIDWLSSAILRAEETANGFQDANLQISYVCSDAMAMAYKIALEKAELLLLQDTGAITESAHFANTMLGEVPLQADSSETGSVRQNEQIVKRNICDIPNCGKVAPMNDIFCADHRH